MRRARWRVTWEGKGGKPVFYHCIGRVVERRFAFGDEEKEKFRTFMRMYENFSGCRVASYCLMSNHFHILLEIPTAVSDEAGKISDELFFRRLSALYSEAFVAGVAKEIADARASGAHQREAEIFARFTYRMHDLTQFMKGLLQRFTQWFNGKHQRRGRLWEDRFKSVIVESGVAARTISAYIDLNPVRAGLVADPAEYRWSSYGEAIGGGRRGNGKKAREGLVRACLSDEGAGYESEKWRVVSRKYREIMGYALERKPGKVKERGRTATDDRRHGEKRRPMIASTLGVPAMLRQRVRYFTDGAVIGAKEFVNEAFANARERFGPRRKDGARKLRGPAAAAGTLWSMRDLRVGVDGLRQACAEIP